MPRQPRPDLADVPQHVVQRGNDRQPCFYVADDYRRYLAGLRESAIRYGCLVHAYVLMTNHVHVLVTPSSAGAVSGPTGSEPLTDAVRNGLWPAFQTGTSIQPKARLGADHGGVQDLR